MRKIGLFAGVVAGLALAGCGEDGVLSSGSGPAPAGKLTISATKAGGYVGARRIRLRHEAERRAMQARDAAAWTANFTEDAVIDYVPAGAVFSGREGVHDFITGLFHGFPDYRCTSEHMLLGGKVMVTEHTTLGSNMGEWMGIPATGKEDVPSQHLDIWEFEGDKIFKLTTYLDAQSLMVQLGLMPPSELPPLEPSFQLPDPEPTGMYPLRADVEAVARYNAHDLYEWSKVFADDADIRYSTLGMVPMSREELIALTELYLLAFPDIHMEVVRRVNLKDGWVLTEAVGTGTNTGPFFGVPATGLPTEVPIAWLFRFNSEGLATAFHVYFDAMTQLVQLGLVPAP